MTKMLLPVENQQGCSNSRSIYTTNSRFSGRMQDPHKQFFTSTINPIRQHFISSEQMDSLAKHT